MAIDGKNVATLHWPDMLRLLKLKPETTTFDHGTALFTEQYPQTQVCSPQNGTPYALVRVHTVTLISSEAAVCVHQRSTLGHTNEIGSMPELLDELKEGYGRSKLFSLVTTDAGNTSCGVAGKMVEQGLEYFAQIKSVHGEIHAEALDMLSQRRKSHCPHERQRRAKRPGGEPSPLALRPHGCGLAGLDPRSTACAGPADRGEPEHRGSHLRAIATTSRANR
ncbi:MAG: hypothetical protein JRH20_25955 [Deltaproteobacteria bacterium]|nr:hypothetical protein [Deltaproteobacteria bacterium]